MEVLCIIPARSGSKSVLDKNIRTLGNKSLLQISIEQSLASKLVSRTIVSTDSEIYRQYALSLGADAPFLRPEEFSRDESTDKEFVIHTLKQLDESQGYVPDVILHLRPTYPDRTAIDIDNVLSLIINDNRYKYDSVRSVVKLEMSAFKMWFIKGDYLTPVAREETLVEPYNMPRQKLPPTYIQNAAVDAFWADNITKLGSISGTRMCPYVMSPSIDIDTIQDLQTMHVRQLMESGQSTFCFDIDGVIATITKNNAYETAYPILATIDLINKLYSLGHRIKIFTARGTETRIDWRKTTEQQLLSWGVLYHELIFGKPASDFYIDDRYVDLTAISKALNDDRF